MLFKLTVIAGIAVIIGLLLHLGNDIFGCIKKLNNLLRKYIA